jgi:hypothetical protein
LATAWPRQKAKQIGGSSTDYKVGGVGTGTSDTLCRNNAPGGTWFAALSNGAFAGWHQDPLTVGCSGPPNGT